MIDDGPSPEDIERFGGDEDADDIIACSSCGAEIWHDAGVCPECLQPTAGATRARPSHSSYFQSRLTAAIALFTVVVIIVFWVFQCSP